MVRPRHLLPGRSWRLLRYMPPYRVLRCRDYRRRVGRVSLMTSLFARPHTNRPHRSTTCARRSTTYNAVAQTTLPTAQLWSVPSTTAGHKRWCNRAKLHHVRCRSAQPHSPHSWLTTIRRYPSFSHALSNTIRLVMGRVERSLWASSGKLADSPPPRGVSGTPSVELRPSSVRASDAAGHAAKFA